MKVVFLDTETTGFKTHDVILSAAYIVVDTNTMKVCDSGTMYFYDEQNRCSKDALAIHHLTEEFLRKYRNDYESNINKLFKLVHNGVVIGHNVSFDVRLINQTLASNGMKAKPYMQVCTMYETTYLNNGKKFKLIDLLEYFKIDEKLVEKKRNQLFGENPLGVGFHSADFDTTAVYLITLMFPSKVRGFDQLR